MRKNLRGGVFVVWGVVWLGMGGARPVQGAVGGDLLETALKYQFKSVEGEGGGSGAKSSVYEIKIVSESNGVTTTISGPAFYEVQRVDAATGQITLSTRGTLLTQRRANAAGDGGGGRKPSLPPPVSKSAYGLPREVVMDGQGNLVKQGSGPQLPFLLGSLGQLVIEPLPGEAGKTTWRVEREIDLWEREGRMPVVPPKGGGQNGDQGGPVKGPKARETITYTLGQVAGDLVTITKQYSLISEEKVPGGGSGGGAAKEQTGEGQISFDTKTGLVESLEMKMTVVTRINNKVVTIPVHISARLLDAAEATKALQEQQAAEDAERAKTESGKR